MRLGQREGPFQLDRVLGRQHQKRAGQRPRDAVNRHLAFLHRFQQGGLCARAGAVDLVCQDDLGGQRAGPELELAGLLVEYADARDIRRQQVRRELNALEHALQRAGQRLGQRRLADAGHILQQHVPLAQEGDQQQIDDLLFPHDDAADIGPQRPGHPLQFFRFSQELLVHPQ